MPWVPVIFFSDVSAGQWYMVVDQSASVLELVHSSQSPAIFMAAFVLAL